MAQGALAEGAQYLLVPARGAVRAQLVRGRRVAHDRPDARKARRVARDQLGAVSTPLDVDDGVGGCVGDDEGELGTAAATAAGAAAGGGRCERGEGAS
eukprot:7018097-Prymnesium_polylepis.1